MPAWSRRSFIAACTLAAAGLLSGRATAEGIELMQAELQLQGEIWQLAGGFHIQLSPTMEGALHRGVQLSFVQAFQARRPRTWWFSEDIVDLTRVIRLSYNALLRQYYVTVSGHSTVHPSLADALEYIGDFSGWAVLHQSQVSRKYSYVLAVRMYLDTSQLPKPLQVSAVGSQRWQLDSGWREWSFRP